MESSLQFFNSFTKRWKKCCNPFADHGLFIPRKGLAITESDKKAGKKVVPNFNWDAPNVYICVPCRKRLIEKCNQLRFLKFALEVIETGCAAKEVTTEEASHHDTSNPISGDSVIARNNGPEPNASTLSREFSALNDNTKNTEKIVACEAGRDSISDSDTSWYEEDVILQCLEDGSQTVPLFDIDEVDIELHKFVEDASLEDFSGVTPANNSSIYANNLSDNVSKSQDNERIEPTISNVSHTDDVESPHKPTSKEAKNQNKKKQGVRGRKIAASELAVRPFPCEYKECEKAFVSKHHLQQHLRRVHSKKLYCSGCGKKLQPRSLLQHLTICKLVESKKLGKLCPEAECNEYRRDYISLCEHIEKDHKILSNASITYIRGKDSLSESEDNDDDNLCIDLVQEKAPELVRKSSQAKKDADRAKRPCSPVPSSSSKKVKPLSPPSSPVIVNPNSLVPNQSQSGFLDRARLTPFFDNKVKIFELEKVCKFSSPDFHSACKVVMDPTSPLPDFPGFVRAFHMSKMAKSGAVVVESKKVYANLTKKSADMEKMKHVNVNRTESGKIVRQGPSNKSYVIKTDTKYENEGYTIADYEQHPHDEPPVTNNHMELQRNVFETLCTGHREYGAHIDAGLFDDFTSKWNLRRLDNDFITKSHMFWSFDYGKKIDFTGEGIKTSFLYIGKYGTLFLIHKEDQDLGSVSYLHHGECKVWFVIPPAYSHIFEQRMAEEFPEDAKKCDAFLRHKSHYINPTLLDDWNIPYTKIRQEPGQYVILAAGTYHFGYNEGFNIAEAVNYHTYEIMPHFLTVNYNCYCLENDVFIPREGVVRMYKPEWYTRFLEGDMKMRLPDQPEVEVHVLNDDERSDLYEENNPRQIIKHGGLNPMSWVRYKGYSRLVASMREPKIKLPPKPTQVSIRASSQKAGIHDSKRITRSRVALKNC